MKPAAPPAKKASPAAPTPSKKAAASPRKKSNKHESSSGSIFEKEALKVKGDRNRKANPLYASEDYVKSGDIPTAVSPSRGK